MSKQQQLKHTWDESNIVDDVQFQAADAELFKNLLSQDKKGIPSEVSVASMAPGTILKGRIVEITKDHVVVDVGLKSEGLVPIKEFSDPSTLVLDAEVEVLLDQPEDEKGQIVLSREKAERLRQWEYILEHWLPGDVALVEAWRADRWGNLVYRDAGRNFNPVMAAAAQLTIVQTQHIAELGALSPEEIATPGLYVDRLVHVAAGDPPLKT